MFLHQRETQGGQWVSLCVVVVEEVPNNRHTFDGQVHITLQVPCSMQMSSWRKMFLHQRETREGQWVSCVCVSGGRGGSEHHYTLVGHVHITLEVKCSMRLRSW